MPSNSSSEIKPIECNQWKLDRCFLVPKVPPVFILAGRHGDICQLSGCIHAIWKRTGMKPVMFTSRDYVSIYDGMSYVVPYVLKENWFEAPMIGKLIAEAQYGGGIVVQFWNDEPQHADTIGFQGKNVIIVQSHGRNWAVDTNLDPDYGTSMARRMGFSRAEWLNLPPVFDRRDSYREAELVKRYERGTKPMLLVNFTGVSSPFGYAPEILGLLQPFRQNFNVIDLGQIRAQRCYDLLAIMDRAAGLITIDTLTAHLAVASPVSTIWLTVPGWGKSIPRGNVALHVEYNQVPDRLEEIRAAVEEWKP